MRSQVMLMVQQWERQVLVKFHTFFMTWKGVDVCLLCQTYAEKCCYKFVMPYCPDIKKSQGTSQIFYSAHYKQKMHWKKEKLRLCISV